MLEQTCDCVDNAGTNLNTCDYAGNVGIDLCLCWQCWDRLVIMLAMLGQTCDYAGNVGIDL